MLGMIDKTALDARGLNRLQRAGTLPAVWIPPSTLRDWRDLPRTRMVLVRQRTRLKNRIHAVLANQSTDARPASRRRFWRRTTGDVLASRGGPERRAASLGRAVRELRLRPSLRRRLPVPRHRDRRAGPQLGLVKPQKRTFVPVLSTASDSLRR
jgi:hypothetical protein